MRKTFIIMVALIAAMAFVLPTAVMAGWDQTEKHVDQDDHSELINIRTTYDVNLDPLHPAGDFDYGMESPIGYDRFGNGTATLLTNRVNNAWGGAPWNTLPCPIQLADPGPDTPDWEDGMGNCPANSDPDSGQTDAGWEDEIEIYGVILDDLYNKMVETASIDTTNTKAFKKVNQVLDILFYRSQTAGEGWAGVGTYTDPTGTVWNGGFGIDQTLDQDVADIEGTTNGPSSWGYDHVAQTLYQDFRIFDYGNQSQSWLDKNGVVSRTRHGLEMLALCRATGTCTYEINEATGYEVTLDEEDFGFFDQWVIQSIRDTYDEEGITEDEDPALGNFEVSVVLEQSYSQWMIQGAPGELCDEINDDGECEYDYNKTPHSVDKEITAVPSTHDTGDP